MKKILNRIQKKYLIKQKNISFFWSKNKKYNIVVMNNYESLKHIRSQRLSVIRFGDGEFDIIRGHDIPYQKYNVSLANEMHRLILKGSTSEVLICLPDIFQDLNRY